METSFSGLRPLFLIFLCLWLGLLVWWMNLSMDRLERTNDPRLPFGVIATPKGIYAQDFSYQMLFFRGIRDRVTARIYTMTGQEQLMRRELPEIDSGMSHAYSPVAFVLALPLLDLPRADSYFAYLILVAVGIILLFRFELLPRAASPFQFMALLVCVMSVCVWADFAAGQSALLTTSLVGALWMVLRHETERRMGYDLLAALLFWTLCLKPSVAIIPFFLLMGERRWRAFWIAVLLLLMTWLFTANLYGGWWTGLRDYAFLLNHYHNGGMGDFMRRGHESAVGMTTTAAVFFIKRNLLLISGISFVFLRWFGRLTGSELFQALIGVFLLFSPYLLPSEDWILCLVVVENAFFKTKNALVALLRLLLLAAILDLRFPLVSFDAGFQLKCILGGWMLYEAVAERRLAKKSAEYVEINGS
jgi:hypothetical protein